MSSASENRPRKKDKKVRVPFRRNRTVRRRTTDWTRRALDADGGELDTERGESVVAKGDLSRRRTVKVPPQEEQHPDERRGIVVAMRGLYAEVDDGERTWTCTLRRVLRTRLIEERHSVIVGDRVRFRGKSGGKGVAQQGVIEAVEPRSGELRRYVGRRVHTMVANVDQAIIVSSADQPPPRPNLIDRYIVAAAAGDIRPVICMNKVDLDTEKSARELLERYAHLGYTTLYTSAVTCEGIESLKGVLKDRASVIAGQSGVGKSSLLNAIQPGLRLKIGDVVAFTSKGRHTTSTAIMIRLDIGGYVVDTPGVRSFDLATVGKNELEALFIEFIDHVPNCKFPDCTHIHEDECAVKLAVERGEIHPERYESYVRLFEEPTEASRD